MNNNVPLLNASCICIPYPEEASEKTGAAGLTVPLRYLFELMARDVENEDPKAAAFYRNAAAHYPDCDDKGYPVDRNGSGAILVDFDDWDELTDEQRLLRGNRNAAIAILDRLRFHLEMMDDDPANREEVDDIRRGLGKLVESVLF